MEESLDGLAVDVGDEVAGSEAGLEGRTALVDGHHQMVHRVKVRVAHVDADGAQREAEAARTAAQNHRRLQTGNAAPTHQQTRTRFGYSTAEMLLMRTRQY